MRILEIKNNLVKISYSSEDNLVLSGFVIIEDEHYPYVAQVMSLKADNGMNYAIVKLLFTFDSEGVVKNYNGTIPELDSNITKLSSEELLDILPIETPFPVGKLAQQNFILNVDYSMFERNLLVCSDNVENTDVLLSNIAKAITSNNDKSIIFDTTGTVQAENKLILGKDFKLPLNSNTINYIYEHDLNDISPSSKAVIQDILIEVQEYSETLIDKFIPFDLFINVIANQAKATQMPELAILKSRLIKYKNENIFAQKASDFHILRSSVRANLSTLIDISNIESSLQQLAFSTVYDELNLLDLYIYSLVKINNENSNKRLIKRFLTENKIFTTVFCSHNHRYVHDLKELSGNIIMFEPQTSQHDFGAYNVFLNKLNPDEAIIYGKVTQNIPLIIEMMPIEALEEYQKAYSENNSNIDESDDKSDTFEDDTYSQESMMVDTQDYSNSGAVEQVAAQVLGSPANSVVSDNLDINAENTNIAGNFNELPELEQNNNVENSSEDIDTFENDQNNIDINIDGDSEDEISETKNINPSDNEDLEEVSDLEQIAEDNIDIEQTTDNQNSLVDDIDDFNSFNEENNGNKQESSSDISNEDDEVVNTNEDNIVEDTDIQISEDNIELPQSDEDENLISEADDNSFSDTEDLDQIPDIDIENVDNTANDQGGTSEYNLEDEVKEELPNINDDNSLAEDDISEETYFPDNVTEETLSEEDLEDIDNINSLSEDNYTQDSDYSEEMTEELDNKADEIDISIDNVKIDNVSEESVALPDDSPADDSYIVNEFSEDTINYKTQDEADDEKIEYEDNSISNDIDEFSNSETINNEGFEFIEDENNYSNEEPTTPVVPVYSAEEDTPVSMSVPMYESGDKVIHPTYGEGVVEKMVKFGNKVLCSISFENGRRLLDPTISQITKIV